jgi:peptidoglycan/xylan/chitin deacetylase (PgdA/CDA1 family)
MNPRHRYIALTLDDGYNFQPALLALLEKYNVRCTTFLIGSWASTHRGEVKSMAAAGLEVANHTWSHSFLTRISPTAMTAQLLRTQKLLLSITGKNVPYLRPPYGDTNPSVKTTAARAGYRLVLWSKTFGDSGRGITAEKAYNNVMRRWGPVVPGDVILCHWGSRESYVALQRIIPELQAKGFTFVTVSELVADSK